MKPVLATALVVILLGVALAAWLGSAQTPAISADIIGLRSLQVSGDGFARADHRRLFTFPDDHGPHPEYQTEWWYYTGNLETADGRHFGYQLTFFRRAIAPTAAARASQWATNQVYFAHFALTDVKSGAHLATERFSRGAAGLAGASGQPYRVWLEDWEVTSLSADGGRVRLRAEDAGRALDLTLAADKPPVLHGDGGLSPKTNAAGNASYYVSFTRLSTQGTLTSGGQTLTVGGLSWMDHEFGTTSLGPDAVGWDWFAAQLSDWREVMFFQIRQRDGSIEPLSSGTLIEADGTARHLRREDVDVQVSGRWASRATGATYPAGWTLTIPSADLRLTLQPYVPDQEMRVSITYWEGAVVITGQSRGQPVSGSGFVELTGYSGAPPR